MKNKQGGVLLFAIITAFVLSFVGATIVILISNQYRITQNDIDRIQKYYLLQAGVEHAIYNLYTTTAGWIPSGSTPVNQSLSLKIPPETGSTRVVNIFIYDLLFAPRPSSWPLFSITSPSALYGIQVTVD